MFDNVESRGSPDAEFRGKGSLDLIIITTAGEKKGKGERRKETRRMVPPIIVAQQQQATTKGRTGYHTSLRSRRKRRIEEDVQGNAVERCSPRVGAGHRRGRRWTWNRRNAVKRRRRTEDPERKAARAGGRGGEVAPWPRTPR